MSSRRSSPWSAAPPVRPEAATFADDPERSGPDPAPDPVPRAGAARLSGPPVDVDANLSIPKASLLVAETETLRFVRFVRFVAASSRRARLVAFVVVFVSARGNSDDAPSGSHASSSSRPHPRATRPPSEPDTPAPAFAVPPDADVSLSLSLFESSATRFEPVSASTRASAAASARSFSRSRRANLLYSSTC